MLEIAKRVAHNLSKPISLELTIKRTIRHVPSQHQDQFYFERSKLAAKNTEMHEKIPVVCILGWAGSLNHHVRKYEQIYSKMGYHTIYFAPTNKTTFLQYRAHKTYTKRFINMVHELGLTKNPIITHMFSNAGCFIVYQHLLTDPEGEFFKRNHKSAIFDSALGLPHKPLKLISGINNLIRPNISSTPLRYLWATGMVAVYRIYHHVNLGNHYFTKMFEIVENDERSVPTLFLYSRQDSLICPDNMRRFVEKRQKGGFHIDPVLYDDCDHCSIYTKHPEDYLNRLRKHLEFSKMDLKTVLSN